MVAVVMSYPHPLYKAAFLDLIAGHRSGPCSRPYSNQSTPCDPSPFHHQRNALSDLQAQFFRPAASIRSAIVQWLIHINSMHSNLRFSPETVYCSVQYFDRILAKLKPNHHHHTSHTIVDHNLYFLASVCLLISAKFFEDYTSPTIPQLQSVINAFKPHPCFIEWSTLQLGRLERQVLLALEFKLLTVAPSSAVLELLFAFPQLSFNLCIYISTRHCTSPKSSSSSFMTSSPGHCMCIEPTQNANWLLDSFNVHPKKNPNVHNPSSSLINRNDGLITPIQSPPHHTNTQRIHNKSTRHIDERWPSMLLSRNPIDMQSIIIQLIRSIQTDLIQRIVVHAFGTAHAPMSIGVVLLNRAIALLTNKCPKCLLNRCVRVPCLATNISDHLLFPACVDMVLNCFSE